MNQERLLYLLKSLDDIEVILNAKDRTSKKMLRQLIKDIRSSLITLEYEQSETSGASQ